ncbi:alpha/beta hydrolase family protein [Sphingomonas alpina]|uniref:Prolyl oligopeptidase family serine peptidase n=1 Tax=Sphingomonas alpina TaxID=653931 RepID=A0A7H0LJB7_9SPHN|nr:prolyl oligopeptidase family serine peptidase [Sphingomonas alpina]QNQ09770.1 prolyl oligopeptidase family serine peptidase [Sphingomonas alpina]
MRTSHAAGSARTRWAAVMLLASAAPVVAADAPAPALTAAQAGIVARAKALGATGIATKAAPGGGLILDGKLDGDQFAMAFPATWNHDALLFAHGYSTPGTPVAVAEDPLGKTGSGGALAAAYAEGFAVGHSAYDKAGMGVQTGTENTLRLRDFMVKLGTKRVYVSGASMGGNIVLSLIEQHPAAFAGALSACGVTDGWESLFGQLIDMRAAYNFLTAGTPYALPGEQDLARSALPTVPPAGDSTNGEAFRWAQIAKVATPVLALSKAATANPDGREAKIVRQVAAIGGFEPEPASLAYPLVTITLGADDLKETLGGQIYGNIGKSYAPPDMTPQEAEAFNTGVQRIAADPAAVAAARQWHQAIGRFRTPLITIHNRIDSLVPYAQTEALGRIVAAAGNRGKLVQYTVPAVKAPLPIGGVEGYTHCGFSAEQTGAAWKALRSWVETGKRPASGAVR